MAQSHPDQELSLYLDDALAPAERALVAAHLAGCPACRTRLGELEGVARLVASLPRPAPRRSLVPRRATLPRWLAPARWASSAAAAVFALAFVVTSLPSVGGGAATSAPGYGPAAVPAAASAEGTAGAGANPVQDSATKQLQPSASPNARSGDASAAPEAGRATAVPRGTGPEAFSVALQREAQSLPSALWLLPAALAAIAAVILWRWPRTLVR